MKRWIQRILIVAVVIVCVVGSILRQKANLAYDPQLKTLRQMMPYWDRAESGGIVLLAEPRGTDARVPYRILAGLPADGSNDTHLEEKWRAALPSLIEKLNRFFQAGHLEPGTYTFPNPYYPLIQNGKFKGPSIALNSDGEKPVIAIPQTEKVTFTVTPEHLKLLRHMNTRNYGAYIEIMDPKRPYGDMTYIFIDMAAALGQQVIRDGKGQPELSANEIENYERLHGEMLWAVAVFLRYAKL